MPPLVVQELNLQTEAPSALLEEPAPPPQRTAGDNGEEQVHAIRHRPGAEFGYNFGFPVSLQRGAKR